LRWRESNARSQHPNALSVDVAPQESFASEEEGNARIAVTTARIVDKTELRGEMVDQLN
jgi:hypothetical protein